MKNVLHKLTDVSDGGKYLPWLTRKVMAIVNGYDHDKYWRRRTVVVDPNNQCNKLLKMYYLLWIKRVDYKHHCSFGTSYNFGSHFLSPRICHRALTT